MPEASFVHLHVHTEYSLLDGFSRIPKLVQRARDLGMPAVAITDHGAMHGVIDFYNAARKADIKPIIGMEAYLTGWGRSRFDKDAQLDSKPYHLLLLARTQTGYQNLLKLASAAQLEGYYYRPRIDHELLAQHAEGLIATSGCLAAEIPRLVDQGRDEEALQRIGWYQDVFGPEHFFLELQHHQIPELHALNRWLIAHQGYANVPFVATNDVHYILESDYDAHDTLLCVQTGNVKAERNRLRFESPTFHLRSPQEMWALFGEVPDALQNTLWIAEQCNVSLDSEGYHLPVFPVPEGHTPQTYLRALCERGLAWRYGARADSAAVRERLDYELAIIHRMGFDTYFLIVWDLCEFARARDIWWNVRGSGAGSVAAYSLGITNIDPLANGLLFERFLNPGRVSMPDIDLDYPEDRRAEMIQYCAQKYGADKVAAIITFGTMGSKAAIRDVGRALDLPLTEVDRIARLIPSGGKPIKFEDALGSDPDKALPDLKEAYETNPDARRLIDAAWQLEGITRHASTHAAGVIVADKPLVEYLPLHRPTKGTGEDAPVKMVTQFPMETCEALGLLKIDFLGLSTLTIMRRACEMIERNHGIRYNLWNIPYRIDPDDPETERALRPVFEMIGRGETIGIFQLESQGMRRMLMDMRPTRFEHIVAAVALYRPGPMDYIPTYNKRLRGAEKAHYIHPLLQPILEETYGIIVYQEQIMQIGASLFGYSLGEADLMRKAVGKKKKEDLLKHRQIFVERGPKHGVDVETANKIFDDIEFFARYGFNKSHAADYAVLTCQTAFLKCHYPHEYMAALMSVHRDDSGKVSLFAADCRRMNIDVLPPTVNHSQLDFSIEPQPDGRRAIRFGLGAVKNVGTTPLEHILEQRAQGGPFRDLDDFCRRVDARVVNKRALESLVKVGALDEFGARPVLLAALDRIVSFSVDHHKAQDIGQLSLFGEATGVNFGAHESILGAYEDVEPVPKREMLNWEKELVGLYVTEHPLQDAWDRLQHAISHTVAELTDSGEELHGQPVTIAGLVTGLRRILTKKGDTMAVLTLEDITGPISVVLFPRTWRECEEWIDEDVVVIVRGKADSGRGELQVIADTLTQNVEFVTPLVDLPLPQTMAFAWLEHDESEDENGANGGNGHAESRYPVGAPREAERAEPEADRAGEDLDDEDYDDSPFDDETGELRALPPADDAPTTISEAVVPASLGAAAYVAPPIEPPSAPPPADPREMPGWLPEDFDAEIVVPDWAPSALPAPQPSAQPSLFDAMGRVRAPDAPAARPREVTSTSPRRDSEREAEAPAPRRAVRPAPPSPQPAPEPDPSAPPRLLTLIIARSGNSADDRRRMRRLHGFLTQYPGHDRFCFILVGEGRSARLDFPNHPIGINDDMLTFAARMVGEENVRIEEL